MDEEFQILFQLLDIHKKLLDLSLFELIFFPRRIELIEKEYFETKERMDKILHAKET